MLFGSISILDDVPYMRWNSFSELFLMRLEGMLRTTDLLQYLSISIYRSIYIPDIWVRLEMGGDTPKSSIWNV